MCKTLFLLVALLAAPIEAVSKMEDAVVPEASTTMQSKDSTNHKDAISFLKSAGSNSIDAAKLVVEKMKVNPGSLASLNQAIDTIIGEITSQSTADQQLVDGMVAAFVTASALPVRDTALDAAQTTTCAVVAPAQTALTASQTKSYQLDFGATAETARLAATGVKGNVDADLQAFEEALRNLGAKTLACSGATTAATAAAGDLATAKDRAYCQAKDSYDLVVTDVTTNSVTHTTNIKHFKMLKCVMTEYAAGTKEKAAFDKCSAQTYDVDVESVTVDLKASQAVVPASTVCVTPAPTPPPLDARYIENYDILNPSWIRTMTADIEHPLCECARQCSIEPRCVLWEVAGRCHLAHSYGDGRGPGARSGGRHSGGPAFIADTPNGFTLTTPSCA